MNLAETETVNQSPLEPKGWANPGGIRFGDFHHPSRVLNLVILKVQTFADMDYTDYTDYTDTNRASKDIIIPRSTVLFFSRKGHSRSIVFKELIWHRFQLPSLPNSQLMYHKYEGMS